MQPVNKYTLPSSSPFQLIKLALLIKRKLLKKLEIVHDINDKFINTLIKNNTGSKKQKEESYYEKKSENKMY